MFGSFFGLFRKSHLLPVSGKLFDLNTQFSMSSFLFYSSGALIKVKWSKTIQLRDRVVFIHLPSIPGSYLCPVRAMLHAMSFPQSSPSDQHAFTYFHPPSHCSTVFTYRSFLFKLDLGLSSLGFTTSDYAGHSFRRGGASHAVLSSVPIEFIKMLGDWKSDSVLLYLTVPLQFRIQSSNMMIKPLI